MSGVLCLHDKRVLEEFLRRDLYLHIYELGDLDEFFWPYTQWFGYESGDKLEAVLLLYVGQTLPVVLAFCENFAPMCELWSGAMRLLPARFYAHLSLGLESHLATGYRVEACGRFFKMALREPRRLQTTDGRRAERLSRGNLEELEEFYEQSYPGNWFDPRMLETGQYYGLRENGKLVGVGGVHVYAPCYGVAALGNIATHPNHRRRGLGAAVTACVCNSLRANGVEDIGLNVSQNNPAAIACYRRLGFEVVAEYGEFMLERIMS